MIIFNLLVRTEVFYLFIISLILNIACSNSGRPQIIYIGTCPWVIGGDCDSDLVKFYIYTRLNARVPEYIEFNNDGKDNLTSSTYDWQHGNKLIIHGFNSNMHLNVLQNLKDEYLIYKNLNIWMVNYPKLASDGPCYPFATYNIRYVGRCVAAFIQRINATTKDDKLDLHAIGFSLGGQVLNYVAENLPFKLRRMTGLDPALPLFFTSLINHKLDPSDAQFVDVIHTNALFQGQILPCGHIDFYLNGGVFQPGCSEHSDRFNCYHARSVEYFSESINTKVGFWGWHCSSFLDFIEQRCKPKEPLELMGEHVYENAPGMYLLDTASSSPYALGRNFTLIKELALQLIEENNAFNWSPKYDIYNDTRKEIHSQHFSSNYHNSNKYNSNNFIRNVNLKTNTVSSNNNDYLRISRNSNTLRRNNRTTASVDIRRKIEILSRKTG